MAQEQIALLNAILATKSDIAKIEAKIEGLKPETKVEIEGLGSETKAAMEGFRREFKASLQSLKSHFIKWMLGAMVAQTTIILAGIAMLLNPTM